MQGVRADPPPRADILVVWIRRMIPELDRRLRSEPLQGVLCAATNEGIKRWVRTTRPTKWLTSAVCGWSLGSCRGAPLLMRLNMILASLGLDGMFIAGREDSVTGQSWRDRSGRVGIGIVLMGRSEIFCKLTIGLCDKTTREIRWQRDSPPR